MTGLKVLAIDTSTEACSAALLWHTGDVRLRCQLLERGHADLILPMIDELLAEAGCRLADLDGLAFGRGPGGFTGLRIAAGVVQGLAYGAGLKVAPVSSLAAVAYLATSPSTSVPSWSSGPSSPSPSILVCNDARMNEVYWGCYRFDPAAAGVPIVLAPDAVSPQDRVEVVAGAVLFAGTGIPRYPALQARLEAAGLRHVPGIYPRADAVAQLGAKMLQRGDGVEAAEAIPVYIRDNVARPAQPTVT
ncbi:MAG: tRNA (adenosine(37)-N6)-threonylcarbamoyltransferase complex dimerization subunit type 1 TsaB [Steroidobacteraceae bacterium]